jgi:hypothetical protein
VSDSSWETFRRRCAKPNGERLGTWTARRFARPVALRITKLVAPTGVSAHAVTLAALATAIAAAGGFAISTPLGWFIGALLLDLWYVLDHVDGQLARWRGTASLDGTSLDYLMHHAVNLIVPQAIAFGLLKTTGVAGWFFVGLAWSCGLMLLHARHDARYKAFIQRLKIVDGELLAIGGGGGRPASSTWPRPNVRAVISWCGQKMCEMHVVAHLLLATAVVRLIVPQWADRTATIAAALLTLPAVLLPIVFIARGIWRGEAESEFALWYRVPADAALEFHDGRYVVESPNDKSVAASPIEPATDVVRTS